MDRFVSRMMRLAYLSPDVLHRLLLRREPPTLTVNDLINTTYLPWLKHAPLAFSKRQTR